MMGVVLCAGLGTRLRPLTDHLPKPLVPAGGRPMVHYPLGLLRAAGVTDVVLNTHYRAAQLQAHLGDGKRWGMHLRYSIEPDLLGTGGGLRHLLPLIDGDPFFVLNVDQITDVSLGALLDAHCRHDAVATLAVIDPDGPLTHRRLQVTDGLLRGLAPPGHKGPIFTGVQVLERRLFTRHSPADPSCVVRDFLLPAIAAGERVATYHHPGLWLDTGDRDSLARAERILAGAPSLPVLS
jgi:MurNAc alpha-1-phosphate uridylyltransferase